MKHGRIILALYLFILAGLMFLLASCDFVSPSSRRAQIDVYAYDASRLWLYSDTVTFADTGSYGWGTLEGIGGRHYVTIVTGDDSILIGFYIASDNERNEIHIHPR